MMIKVTRKKITNPIRISLHVFWVMFTLFWVGYAFLTWGTW